MHSNISKNIVKIYTELLKINKSSKKILKYGSLISLLIMSIGAILLVINNCSDAYNVQSEFVAISIIRVSFTILAEVIIGGLLIDYILNKK